MGTLFSEQDFLILNSNPNSVHSSHGITSTPNQAGSHGMSHKQVDDRVISWLFAKPTLYNNTLWKMPAVGSRTVGDELQ